MTNFSLLHLVDAVPSGSTISVILGQFINGGGEKWNVNVVNLF